MCRSKSAVKNARDVRGVEGAASATIIRVKHRRAPFVVIDRRVLEDERLTWAARGMLGYLLAKPDDWKLRITDLQRRGNLGATRCAGSFGTWKNAATSVGSRYAMNRGASRRPSTRSSRRRLHQSLKIRRRLDRARPTRRRRSNHGRLRPRGREFVTQRTCTELYARTVRHNARANKNENENDPIRLILNGEGERNSTQFMIQNPLSWFAAQTTAAGSRWYLDFPRFSLREKSGAQTTAAGPGCDFRSSTFFAARKRWWWGVQGSNLRPPN